VLGISRVDYGKLSDGTRYQDLKAELGAADHDLAEVARKHAC
jgi:hypothetical protein